MKNTLYFFFGIPKLLYLTGLVQILFFNLFGAQSTLFQISSLTKGDLSGSSLALYEKLESGTYTKSLSIVNGINFTQQAADGYVEIMIPGDTALYAFKAKFVEAKPNGDISWYGETVLSTPSSNYGYASFQIQGGELLGDLTTEAGVYSLFSIANENYVLVEYEDDGRPIICGLHEPPGNSNNSGHQESHGHEAQYRGTNCDVKVLVLYTSAALNKSKNINLEVNSYIAQANNILRNSYVNSQSLTFFLAGHELMPEFTESADIDTDLDVFTDPSSPVHLRRNELNADCVVLLTDGKYGDILGFTPSCGPTSTGAFSIVEIEAAGPWKTFTHELGHQFGCKHSVGKNNGGCEPTTEQPHWFHWKGRDRYTVMETDIPKKKDRIPHFSNPGVSFHEIPTGTGMRNNVLQLIGKACEVAGYRNSEDLTAYIDGESHVCLSRVSDPAVFYAVVNGGGPGTYNYAWQTAINGYTYSPVLIITDVLTLDLSNKQVGDVIFIRLTVTSPNQQVIYAYFNVFIIDDTPECLNARPLQAEESLSQPSVFQIRSNPVDEEAIALINAVEESTVGYIELRDSFGKLYSTNTFSLKATKTVEIPINTASLPSGTYFLRLTANSKSTVKKLTVLH